MLEDQSTEIIYFFNKMNIILIGKIVDTNNKQVLIF
jgi:hypothetical protein